MDIVTLHQRATAGFGARVHAVADDQWTLPTPCAQWDVRQLVNHVVGENRWAVPLLSGSTIAEVGSRLDGDLLGDDPMKAWDASAAEVATAVSRPGAMDDIAHLSFADLPGREYAAQLFADALIHGWDLARAIGADERLDPELVDACAEWFGANEDGYRSAGVIAPRPTVPSVSDGQTQLLVAFGRDPSPDDTLSVIRRFNEAFGRHDVDAVMALMTDDCVFEDTTPPDGRRHEGQAAVRAAWEALFSSSASARFVTEEGVLAGDRATFRWRYVFDGGEVRGVDVFLVRDGKVAEKCAYVKG